MCYGTCYGTVCLNRPKLLPRSLEHLLPKAFQIVHLCGLLHPANRGKLKRLQETLNSPVENETENEDEEIAETTDLIAHAASIRCPCCHSGHMVLISILSPKRRAPP
jgi:hypothetical protein